jgi:carbon-monoxide dehydrogenase iron sulfur subunit
LKKITVKEEHCIGCGLCEVYCTVQHSKSKDIIKAYNRENPRPTSRVKLEVHKPVSFAIQCRHCEDAPCVTACLSGAMQKDEETGLVTHDPEKCIGCWTCIMVCPFGAIKRDSSGKVVSKCDLCAELEVPACVANCPNGALVYKEVKK